ncbi:OmpA family protein [Sulfurospirillum sp. 1307]|jgi:OOP family OmpA-OmpF porin
MKKIVLLLFISFCLSYAGVTIKSVEGATNSGITEGSLIPDKDRPKGFIIRHVKDDVDQDGVKDVNDECPDTPDGKVVDPNGCTKVIVLKVNFDFDKYDIKDEFKDEIKEAVMILKKNQSYKAVIEGHTDSVGTNEYNYVLSELRAKKVALAINEFGIDKSRLMTKGYGETVPIASNETKKGRAQNRRVEISFNKK